MRLHLSPLVLSLVVACFVWRPAHADGDRSSALVVTGDAPHIDGTRAAATEWLTKSSWGLTTNTAATSAAEKARACIEVPGRDCAAAIQAIKVHRLWFLSAREQTLEGAKHLVVTGSVYDANGSLLAKDKRYCESCGADGRKQAVDDLLDALARSIAAQSGTKTILRIRTVPPSATISIDGESIGQAPGGEPLETEVSPGPHTITGEAPKHRPETKSIDVREGDTHEVDLVLEPIGEPPKGRGPLPWIASGVGVAALAGGVGLMLADEDDAADGRSNHKYTDTMLPGIALTAAGTAALSYGVYLFVRSPSDRQPVVSLSRDGAWFGCAGSF